MLYLEYRKHQTIEFIILGVRLQQHIQRQPHTPFTQTENQRRQQTFFTILNGHHGAQGIGQDLRKITDGYFLQFISQSQNTYAIVKTILQLFSKEVREKVLK